MTDSVQEEFAARLMSEVRDRAIVAMDQLISGAMRGPRAKAWQDLPAAAKETLIYAIPDIVDETLFQFLRCVDEGLLVVGIPGRTATVELGELAGWFMGSDGWRSELSGQRYNDYAGELS